MQYRLTCRPGSEQPLPVGQTAFNDPPIDMPKLQASAAALANPAVEVNGVLDLRPWCPPIDNQGPVSDCVADSTTSALEFLQIRNGLPFVKKSRLFLYYNARLQNQETDKDQGTYIRLAFATLQGLGTCTEATWPYDMSKVFTRPSWESYQEAWPHRIASYYNIPTDSTPGALVDAVKQALQAQHVVVFAMTVDQAYGNSTGHDGVVAMPPATRIGSGGHAQVIVGYDNNRQCWIVRNSWGNTWGDKGYCYVPWAYLPASNVSDVWVPTLPPAGASAI